MQEKQRLIYLQQQLSSEQQIGHNQAKIAYLQAEIQAQNERIDLINQKQLLNLSEPNKRYDERQQQDVETKVAKDMTAKLAKLKSQYKAEV